MSDDLDIRTGIIAHQRTVDGLVNLVPEIEVLGNTIANCLRGGHRVYTCGNGGSAAHAQHLAAELVGRFRKPRPPFTAIALCADSSVMTALANDFSFEEVFARQVMAHGQPEDLLVVFSTSGKSPNCIRAAQAAAAIGTFCCALTGARPNRLVDVTPFTLQVPSTDPQRIQEMHHLIIHLLCGHVEAML